MKIKITKQITRTIEITPVQKRKRPTGGQAPQQSVILKALQIINHIK